MFKRLNKLMRLPEIIPCDKRMHFMVGTVYATIAILLLPLWAFLISVTVVAWGIEFYQKFTKSGTFDNFDAVAVVFGAVPILIVYMWRL